jgi:8-oxo-dGTP pyrophosphatase MutT (NUDIX family)
MSLLSASNVTPPAFNVPEFERLARARLLQTPAAPGTANSPGDDDLDGRAAHFPAGLQDAAVLVGIVSTPTPTVILTERAECLSAHAGQIAFPGGRIELSDAGPLAAALREAHEEIALEPAFVEPLGYLEPYRTGTGFCITPAVALIRPGFSLSPDPNEVADIFEVPLAFLMSEANHRIDSRIWRGAERRFYAMPYGERYIWGATAGIIRTLYRRLFRA